MSNGLLSEKYQIIKVLPFEGEIKYLLGRSNVAADDRLVLINEISNRNWINAYLAELLVQAQERKIPDFVECFAEKEKLYVTFIYKQGMPLFPWLQKHQPGFTERIALFCSILEKFLDYQGCPAILQYAVIQQENIIIMDHALDFNYQLVSDYEGDRIKGSTVFRNLETLLHTMFSEKEVAQKPGLNMIGEKCKKNIYLSVGEMIRDVVAVTKEPTRKPFLWEKIIEIKLVVLAYLSPILYIVIGIGVATYLWNFWHVSNRAVTENMITKIGSVEVAQRQEKVAPKDIIVKVQDFPLPQATVKREQDASLPELASHTYTVQQGDTLRDVCINQYGSVIYVQELAQFNQLPNKDLIYPGDTLQLPDKVAFKQDH